MANKYTYSIVTKKQQTKFIIYKCTNLINDKIYIGQTINKMERRMAQHFNSANKPNQAFSRALLKYGCENFKWEIIDYAQDKSELNELEIYYIHELKSQVKLNLGYNISLGGNSSTRIMMTQEQRDAQGKRCRQYYIDHPEKVIEMSNKIKNLYIENPHILKQQSESIKLSYLNNPKRKENTSIRMKKYFSVDKNKDVILEIRGFKWFNVYNKNTKQIIGKWINQSRCASDLKLNSCHIITDCLNKKRLFYNDFVFIYIDEDQIIPDYIKANAFIVYKKNTQEYVGEWDSNIICSEDLGINRKSINKCLKDNLRSHNGYVFIYKDDMEYNSKLNSLLYDKKKAKFGFTRKHRPFNIYSKDGEFVRTFTNTAECAAFLNLKFTTGINQCLNNTRKSAGNHIFKYEDIN